MKRQHRNLAALALCMGFLLGIREGRLTLWREGEAHPEQVYDIRADTLPPADRVLLSRGIRVESREELWQLLEDYLE